MLLLLHFESCGATHLLLNSSGARPLLVIARHGPVQPQDRRTLSLVRLCAHYNQADAHPSSYSLPDFYAQALRDAGINNPDGMRV